MDQSGAKRGVVFSKRAAAAAAAGAGPPKPPPDLHKTRPPSPEHLGQAWWRELARLKRAPNRRLGFERLAHMQSVGIPFKFEEFQGRHPFDFVEETKEHFKQAPRPAEKSQRAFCPVKIDDWTLFPIREWMEPLRKGQAYYDYCRDKWMGKVSQLGSAVAPACSMYSLWSVTDHCLQNDGLAFMIAYFVMLLLFVIPVIYMELVIGQFNRFGVARSMKQICPLFLGVGYLMLLACFGDYLFSLTRLSWLLFYMASSIRPEFPWKRCNQDWNTEFCKEIDDHKNNGTVNVTYAVGERTPAVEHFRINVLREFEANVSKSWTEMNLDEMCLLCPHIGVALCFLVLLPKFHYMIRINCQELGRKMYYTFQLAFFLIVFSFAFRRFATAEIPEMKAVRTAFNWFFDFKKLSKLSDKNAWLAAFRHAIISSGIGTGIHVTFGSHNPFINHEIKYNAVITGLIGYLVHFLVAMFFVICHCSLKQNEAFANNTAAFGNDSLFEMLPQLAAQHQPSRGYCWMMFNSMAIAIFLLSVLRILSSLRTIQQYFCDRAKAYYEPLRNDFNFWETQRALRQKRMSLWMLSHRRKGVLMAKIVAIMGVIQLMTFFSGGEFYFKLVERQWYKYFLPMVIALECFVVFFFLGVRMLNSYVRKMTTWQATLWFRFMWKSVTPCFPVLYFVHFNPFMDPDQDNVKNPVDSYALLGIYSCAAVLVILFFQVMWVWLLAPCRKHGDRLLLMVTPEHDHADVMQGIRPLTRLHWMHHTAVPSGIARGAKLQPHSYPVVRYNYPLVDKLLWDFLWNKLGLKFLNKGDGCPASSCFPRYDNNRKTKIGLMFASEPLDLKPEKEAPPPNYLPNKQIINVIKMRKQPVTDYRKMWIKDKMEFTPEKKKDTLQQVKEFEIRKRSITAKRMSVGNRKSAEMSSSPEDSSSDSSSTSEWDSDFSPDHETSPYAISTDDSESIDWEHFSDNSVYSTESEAEHEEKTAGGQVQKRKTIKKTFGEISFVKGDTSVENILTREREYFDPFTIDELEEFEEIMDEGHDHEVYLGLSDPWSASTSETDTDQSSDTIRKELEMEDELESQADVFISDADDRGDDPVWLKSKVRRKKSSGSDGRSNITQDLEGSFSSCSTSCSSGSSWSGRSPNAPPLAEDRGVIVRKKNSKHSVQSGSTKKAPQKKQRKKEYKEHDDADELEAMAIMQAEADRQNIPMGAGGNVFTDVKRRIQNFLSVNIHPRRHPLNEAQKDEDEEMQMQEEFDGAK